MYRPDERDIGTLVFDLARLAWSDADEHSNPAFRAMYVLEKPSTLAGPRKMYRRQIFLECSEARKQKTCSWRCAYSLFGFFRPSSASAINRGSKSPTLPMVSVPLRCTRQETRRSSHLQSTCRMSMTLTSLRTFTVYELAATMWAGQRFKARSRRP